MLLFWTLQTTRRIRIINPILDTLDGMGGVFASNKIHYLINPHYRNIPSFTWISDLPPNHVISSIGWTEFSYSANAAESDFDTLMDKFIELMESHGFEQLEDVINVCLLRIVSVNETMGVVFWKNHDQFTEWGVVVSLEKGEETEGTLNVYVRAREFNLRVKERYRHYSNLYRHYWYLYRRYVVGQ